MIKVYVYVLDTMADWELGHLLPELNTRRFFGPGAPELEVCFVGANLQSIATMGGVSITPSISAGDVAAGKDALLVLPGADTWQDPQHGLAVEKAKEMLQQGGKVAAICGATIALAQAGLLDDRPHTSNGAGFLEMFAPAYKGALQYKDEPSVSDGQLITAGATGAVGFTRNVLEALGVMSDAALNAWEGYFSTGSAECFYALMQATAGESSSDS